MGEKNEFFARNYQVELMQIAVKDNTIIYLPTGAGKTYVAIMVLKQLSEPLNTPRSEGGKITVLLVNTVALVHQHGEYIRRHTTFRVGEYTGDQNLDFWTEATWNEECEKYQVLVMTAQILANGLERKVLDLHRINFLIFDECHRGVQDQPMRQVMKCFQHTSSEQQPRVLGLTATLLNGNCKPCDVRALVEGLETTYHSKVATVDELEQVLGYSTNPKEKIVAYDSYEMNAIEQDVVQELDNLAATLKNVLIKEFPSPTLPDCKPFKKDTGLRELSNLVSDAKLHIQSLGTYGGIVGLTAHMIQIECMRKTCSDRQLHSVLTTVRTTFTYAISLLRRQLSGDKRQDILQFSSPKVLSLIAIIRDYKGSSAEEICGIVFVQRRFTAKVLYNVLKDLAEHLDEFSYLKPNFVVGVNANPFNNTRELLYCNKVMREIILDFYAKNFNLLVSSNVLEEGVDVPTCSLVIKFDEPLDYRAYIQSKGRARHQSSWYCMMVAESEKQKYYNRYRGYQMIEDELNAFLIGRNEERDGPSRKDIKDMYEEDVIPPYYVAGPGSAHVTSVSACTVLSAYCHSFATDVYTLCTPYWFIEEDDDLCRVVIELPTICPYLEPIMGEFMPNRKLAKRSAAMAACIKLHQLGELDNNLKHRQASELDPSTDYLFPHYKVLERLDPMKKKNMYKIQMPACCTGTISSDKPAYLHLVTLTPRFKLSQDISAAALSDLYSSPLCYGMLSSKPLPIICRFPVFVNVGEIAVDFRCNVRTILLTERQIRLLKNFNQFLYKDILSLLKPYLAFDDESTLLMVPVDRISASNCEIDFDVIENHLVVVPAKEQSSQECTSLDITESNYLGKIVVPFYRQNENIEYVVTQVRTDMSPASPFPSGRVATFYDYYKATYRYEIKNLTQPLLEVKALSSHLTCTKPRGAVGKRKRDQSGFVIHLVPEMVVVQTFPASLWVQARILPTVTDKVFQLLRAEELRVTLARWTGVGQPAYTSWDALTLDEHLLKYVPEMADAEEPGPTDNVEECDVNVLSIMSKMNRDVEANSIQGEYPWDRAEEPVDIERNLKVTGVEIQDYMNFINKTIDGNGPKVAPVTPSKYLAITFDHDYVPKPIALLRKKTNDVGPQLADIFRALAAAKADEIVNLERLETLGDSLLKYACSLYILLKFPKFNEGKSTTVKGRMISNRNLYILAIEKELGSYVKFFSLKPRQDWTPPGFCIPEAIRRYVRHDSSLTGIELPEEERMSGALSDETVRRIKEELFETESDAEKDPVNSSTLFFLGYQVLKPKTLSDVCEALIGAYVEACGVSAGLKVIEWLGVIPKYERVEEMFKCDPPGPLLGVGGASQKDVDFHIPQYRQLEEALGYRFRNRAYLLQALTHASYSPNRITGCYQRLEFLGDAVLDFLITCHIYENCQSLKPGDLTDLRSALVNNVTFACFAVRCGLHKHLLAMNAKLLNCMDRFVRFQENRNFEVDDEVLVLLNEDDLHIAEYVDVPKVLGDLFEAIAGAVYFDCGMNLETVWTVFYRIMWKEIERFKNKVPKNAVRMLYETPGVHPEFHKAVKLENGKRVMVKVDFLIDGVKKRVHGFGDNKVVAKRAAAKIALRLLGR